jgi:hypothetical protein
MFPADLSSGSANRRKDDERTPLLPPTARTTSNNSRHTLESNAEPPISAQIAFQNKIARKAELQSKSHLRGSIGTYLSLRPEAVRSAASQARARGPAETQPSRWQSRFLTSPAPTPTQVLANAKETLVRDISQAQVDEDTFRSMVGEQKEKVPEDTMEELMYIFGQAMVGASSEASRGGGGA